MKSKKVAESPIDRHLGARELRNSGLQNRQTSHFGSLGSGQRSMDVSKILKQILW